MPRRGLYQPGQLGAARGRHRHRDRDLTGRDHHLVRLLVDDPEHRAQRLVPTDHIIQRRGQRRRIQRALQPPRVRQVIGGARPVELFQEPQPCLGERQRQPLRPHRHPPQRRPRRLRAVQHPGQRRYRRVLEYRSHRQFRAQHRPDPADQTGGQQRMTAQVEEAVLHPDLLQAQHLREHLAQGLLP
jgi:hypothetical protein